METRVFTDLAGNTILKRQILSSGNLDTYYIYNNAGMIAYILPPLATNALAANSYNLTTTPLVHMVYIFNYDTMGRLTRKTVPAKGVTLIVYNPQNEPVLTQDANMAGSKKWHYIKYDAKSRMIGTGIYVDNVHITLTQMQNYVADTVSYTTWYETRSATASTTGYYTNVVFPTGLVTHTTTTPLAYAYYDNYILAGTTPNFGYIHQGLTNEDSVTTAPLKGIPTVTTNTTVGSGITAGEWLTTATFYDKRGNPIQTQSNNLLYYISFGNLTDLQTVVPDFTGVPQITKVSKQTASGTTATIQTNLTYDQSYRVTAVDQYYNGSTTVSHVAAYKYNEAGQLVLKNLGYVSAGSWLQNVDMRYNIRGQLMNINNSKLAADTGKTNNDTNDVFGMDLYYNTSDGHLTSQVYYDGKMASAKWMATNASGAKGDERAFVYGYDGVNRYTGETYSERATTATSPFIVTHGWDENSIKYDVNGNIQALRRDSLVQGTLTANSGILIDQLKYTYNGSIPDQLYTVYDSSSSAKGFIGGATGSHYTYDANGNLTNEPYQGITGITCNVLNRTDSTKISGTTYITYTYDAGGMLLRKKAYNSGTLTQTDYIGGFVYTGNGTTQTLAYAPMPEGRLIGATLTQEYVITDPQGNARVAFQNVSGAAKVTQENSYYGYGLLMPGSLVGFSAPPNKNLYNGGSEWQNDTKGVNAGVPNYYQTYYRNYDPALARFVAVDPMAEGTSDMSVFQYAGDNPIMGNDPGGDLAAVKNNLPPPVNNTFSPYVVGGGGNGGTLDPLTGEGSLDGQNFGGISDDDRSDFSYYWNGQIDHAMVAINMLNNSISSGFAIAASFGVYANSNTSGIDPGASGTVQNPDSQSENITPGPIIDNHLYIQFQPDESLFTDPGTDPYSFAGNLFHIPINATHQIPGNGSELTQSTAFLCGFFTTAAVLRYLGKQSDGFGVLLDYSRATNNVLKHFMANGITFNSALDELTPFLNFYFSGGYTDNPGMILFFGHPIIAFLNEGLNPDGSTLGHIVFVTGVSTGTYNSITGTGFFTFRYWDPQTGFYQNASPSNLNAPYVIRGLK